MKKILVLSVGGSAEPIVNAIKIANPDFVYFFCSSMSEKTIDSPGYPCYPKGKAIVFQTGLNREHYEIITVENPDDLDACYQKLIELTEKINIICKDCQVIANYTGGTKTMSAAMALVGIITEQWDLSLNVGDRVDLIKVRSGDVPVAINKWSIFYQNQLNSFREPLDNYYYAFVDSSISGMLTRSINVSLRDRLIRIRVVCEAFDQWDRFHHGKALDLLEPHGNRYHPYIIILKKILGKNRATGYEMVSDLLNNAERRAIHKHYDDAIARLYRATELFAQIRLEKEYGYKSGDLTLDQLPDHLKDEYTGYARNGKLILGLRDDYVLLSKLEDPVGIKYNDREGRIIDALTRRNLSIGAHGLVPMYEEDYNVVKDRLRGFIIEAASEIGVNLVMDQLPGSVILQ